VLPAALGVFDAKALNRRVRLIDARAAELVTSKMPRSDLG
jgi:hypothetical protein